MAVHTLRDHSEWVHLVDDVPALLIVVVVLSAENLIDGCRSTRPDTRQGRQHQRHPGHSLLKGFCSLPSGLDGPAQEVNDRFQFGDR